MMQIVDKMDRIDVIGWVAYAASLVAAFFLVIYALLV